MSLARKIKREAQIQKRRAQRIALKDQAVRELYDKQFQAGFERGLAHGYQQAVDQLKQTIKEEEKDTTDGTS